MRPPTRERITAAATIALIMGYQFQLVPFFSPLFVGDHTVWPIMYYGFWGLTALAWMVAEKSWPVLMFSAGLILLAFLFPVGTISKTFIVTVGFFAFLFSLSRTAGAVRMLQLSAIVTAVNAGICLLDILFAHGLTNTPGRASGLSVNPNLAAIGLLVGAAASYWTIPNKWLGFFLMLVFAAIFATLSKSVLFAYVIIFAAVLTIGIWQKKYVFHIPSHAAVGVVLVGWIYVALSLNSGFVFHTSTAFKYASTAVAKFQEARSASIAAAKAPATSAIQHVEGGSDQAAPQEDLNKLVIEQLSKHVDNEGDINSISARGLLMERAWLAYLQHPFLGVGLTDAHQLQPHNSFLLFALAFGIVGWLVPLGFIAFARGNLPLVAATFTATMVSHDFFLMPALLCPLALAAAAKPDSWSEDKRQAHGTFNELRAFLG